MYREHVQISFFADKIRSLQLHINN